MSARVETLHAAGPARRETAAGWSSRTAFILAAAGSAVGLGNVWKFPYIAGEYGGGAFVLVYLACVALIGLPILVAEILVGRRGGASPIHGLRLLARSEGHRDGWQLIGWLGVLGAFLILSFYSVVAGWSLAYLGHAVGGGLAAASRTAEPAAAMEGLFSALLASPSLLLLCHTLMMAATVLVVSHGVRQGLERAVRWMVPGLFALLIGLVAWAGVATGHFGDALAFLFRPSFGALTGEAVLVALGHAFFTLSVGMTAMMAYGAALNRRTSIGAASVAIAGLDTLVALLAGLAIFPVVFANGLEPGSGPGLIFVTLPIAFSQIPGGLIAATLFFAFLAMAALTSTISLLEPAVQFLEGRGWGRRGAALATGAAVWLLGVGSLLSFNLWSGYTVMGRSFFELLDFVTANVLLPLGGLLVAVYAGRVLSRDAVCDELGLGDSPAFRLWRFMLRYVSPVGVAVVFAHNLL